MNAPVPGCPGCEALAAELSELRTLVARLQEQIAELTARLNQNSRNSSQPPSADPPDVRAQRPRPPTSGRKPGGQPGHKGGSRRHFPREAITATVAHYPESCRGCGAALAPARTTGAPAAHHVADLVPVRLQVTEHLFHRCTCPACGTHTVAPWPAGVPRGNWGPGLQAVGTVLTGYCRLSRRLTRAFLATWLGDAPSLATLVAWEAGTTRALAAAVREARAAVATAPVLNVDETGWRQRQDRPTLWVACTPTVSVFRLGRRDRAAFAALVPRDAQRIVGSDRYVVYDTPSGRRQLCWAHLRRNFQALWERAGPGAWVARWALDEIGKLFRAWHAYRAGTSSQATWWAALAACQTTFRGLLSAGAAAACRATRNLCSSLQDRWEGLWTFATEEGVDPTNNAAERALRAAVLWRKNSFGHQSPGGGLFVETMLTVCGSLRLQRRGVLEFVQHACEAALKGTPPPRLVLGDAG